VETIELLFDIETGNGEKVDGCYFIKYQTPVFAFGNNIMNYVDHSIKCFDGESHEEINVELAKRFNIIKIYDKNTNIDYTEQIFERHQKMNEIMYPVLLPYWRRVEKLKMEGCK
jgi:hypothetical protein